jgi:hypothetical protein
MSRVAPARIASSLRGLNHSSTILCQNRGHDGNPPPRREALARSFRTIRNLVKRQSRNGQGRSPSLPPLPDHYAVLAIHDHQAGRAIPGFGCCGRCGSGRSSHLVGAPGADRPPALTGLNHPLTTSCQAGCHGGNPSRQPGVVARPLFHPPRPCQAKIDNRLTNAPTRPEALPWSANQGSRGARLDHSDTPALPDGHGQPATPFGDRIHEGRARGKASRGGDGGDLSGGPPSRGSARAARRPPA